MKGSAIMAIIKQNTTIIRNGNNTRIDSSIKVTHTLSNNTMKVFCGTVDNIEDIQKLMQLASYQNNMVGDNMAVGCIVSDKPLTNEQLANMIKCQGNMKIAMKKMRGRMIPMNPMMIEE